MWNFVKTYLVMYYMHAGYVLYACINTSQAVCEKVTVYMETRSPMEFIFSDKTLKHNSCTTEYPFRANESTLTSMIYLTWPSSQCLI